MGKDSQSLETQIQMLPRRQLRIERCSPQSQELASMSQLTPKTFKRPKRRLSEAFRERNSITKLAWSTASVQKFLKIKLNSEPRRRPVFFIRWILSLAKTAYYELMVASNMPTSQKQPNTPSFFPRRDM